MSSTTPEQRAKQALCVQRWRAREKAKDPEAYRKKLKRWRDTWRERNPERYKEVQRIYKARHYAKNCEEIKARSAAYYAAHKNDPEFMERRRAKRKANYHKKKLREQVNKKKLQEQVKKWDAARYPKVRTVWWGGELLPRVAQPHRTLDDREARGGICDALDDE